MNFFGISTQIVVLGTIALLTAEIEGYGFRFRQDPFTRETQLWTYLPGMEQPAVYQNDYLVKSGGFAGNSLTGNRKLPKLFN
jgi:hypothetical protein